MRRIQIQGHNPGNINIWPVIYKIYKSGKERPERKDKNLKRKRPKEPTKEKFGAEPAPTGSSEE